ncbi:MAG: FAD:protein FMN transferase [Bacteroidales bacterium]|nr:FAD:protein FMN transferase [Bacteroidales bacterium]
MKKILFAGICILIVLFTTSCSNGEKRFVFDGTVQGTYYHIVIYNDDSTGFRQGFDSIFTCIDNSVSLWVRNSLLSRVNRNENVILDDIFKDNFIAAQRMNKLTDGALDITVGALVKSYGFSTQRRTNLSQRQINDMLKYVGMDKVFISGNKLIKKYPQTQIDFNAIAQGYTTDMITKYLDNKGIRSFLIDVGGEVYARGLKPKKEKWKVAIEQPTKSSNEERSYNATVSLKDESIVTSGSYRKFYEENGVKYSHTIDPKTGRPVRHSLLSVSVIAKDATTADGLATSFMVMGLNKSIEFLQNHKEYSAYFIYSDSNGELKIWYNDSFKNYLN